MFHARRTKTKVSPDRVDTAVKVIEEQVIPGAQKLPGFVGGYWLLDRSTGEGVGFTFFDSRESLEASQVAADQIRAQATQEIGAEVVGVDLFEVVANTGDRVHRDATHARVIEFGGDGAQLDEGIKRIKENVIPTLHE